jgi:FkbM family methyltransferase
MGMLMSVYELSKIWDIRPNGVLHVGAHEGEEAGAYETYNWLPVIWVEAQPELAKKLELRLNRSFHTVIHAAVWDQNGITMKFNVASNSQSSSLLGLGLHALDYPDIQYVSEFEIETHRLDELLRNYSVPSFVNLDIQGAEGMAIKGLGKSLDMIDAIYTEINKNEVYIGCTLLTELDDVLKDAGFNRVATRWILGKGWGDALYLRSSVYQLSVAQKVQNSFFALNHYWKQIKSSPKSLIRSVLPTRWPDS